MSPRQLTTKLLSWAGDDLEPDARVQAEKLSRMPFIAGHVALMPDAHLGKGSTIGSVIPTKRAIIPAAVGVDIGCGMIAARLNLTSDDLPDDLSDLHRLIASVVPAGLGKGHESASMRLERPLDSAAWRKYGDPLFETARKQMGSLGSGNHFVEVCLDQDDTVWTVLHSGSRGVGNKLASVHIDIAKGLMKDWFINLEDPDLAYLVQGTVEFAQYISDMNWAQSYAMSNRQVMLDAVFGAVQQFLRDPQLRIEEQINCHHNFTQMERHGKDNVWVTRKGAIKADVGNMGVIPGSMGTRSYIVEGLGNDASYHSCSHGAGRRMGRKQAKRTLDYAGLEKAMEGKAWNHDEALLDEDPRAYKDIDTVMANQEDLVRIRYRLHQVLNYKGTDE